MVYSHLLEPTRRSLLVSHWKLEFRSTHASHRTNIDILRTNRNINREAAAVLYRDVVLVAIDWDASERAFLNLYRTPKGVAFNFVHPSAPLPPCVVGIQQRYHDESDRINRIDRIDRMSTIVAAADFSAICRLLSKSYLIPQYHKCGARTSYSLMSLPKTGYNVENLRELIWSPLSALRDHRLGDYGDRTQRNLSFKDCTGIFEQTAQASDWYSESNDEDETDQGNESDDGHSDDHSIEMDNSGEEGCDAEDIGDGESGEDEGGSEEDNDEDGNNDEGRYETDDGEDGRDKAPSNEHPSIDLGATMSNCASFTSSHDEMATPRMLLETSGVGGRSDNGPGHRSLMIISQMEYW